MPLKHFYSANIQAAARNLRAKDRDFVMGIGAETYAELDDLVRKPPGVSVPASEQNGSTSKLCTGPSSKPDFMNERLDPQIAPSDNEEDDSGSEVVIISSSIIPKRRLSATSTPGPRSKRARVTRALSDEPELPDSESEEDSGEDESEYNDEEAVDPANQKKSDAAGKEFNSACRNCKSNANRALKAKYELQIFKLKSEHKQELRELKADKTKMLADKKKKASDERAKTKVKYEKHIKELKSHRDEKIGDMVEKHKKATEEWQEKADKHKKKIKAVTAQRDEAEAKRKEMERSADEDIKAAKDDLKAGERKLREEKKQMMREKQQEIDILKPHHSIIVKERDKAIRDLTQDAVQREKDVQSRDNALQRLQTAHETLQQQLKHLKTEHSDNQKHTKQVEKDLNDTKKYIAGVDGRADVRLVRAQEKIEVQETNVREHANRVITLQRENYNLKDTVNQLARLGREKRDEVERLKVELQSTKAELGVVKDMEGMSGGFD